MANYKKMRNAEYYGQQNCYDALYEKSKRGCIFTRLMDIIASESNIRLAYRNVKRNKGSYTAGVDKINICDIKKLNIEQYINMIQKKLNWYIPQAVKRSEIKKETGGIRPLGIPTITDRIVQQCILQILDPICEAKFHARNNGYRTNRAPENAIAQCYDMITDKGMLFVVDVDIKGFFDNVDHSKLIRQIWAMGIRDKRLLCVIKSILKAPIVMPNGRKVFPSKGVPQGGILSPLLANIVLNELDWWISNKWETSRFTNIDPKKEIYIVRYVDDFKLFCRDKAYAYKMFEEVKQWLKKRLKLDICQEKSKVVNLKQKYSDFLGFSFKAVNKGGDSYEVVSHMSDRAIMRESNKLIKLIKSINHSKDSTTQKLRIDEYNAIVIGIHQYYSFATEIKKGCMIIQALISRTMGKYLKNVNREGVIKSRYIFDTYGKSDCIRFIDDYPICPIEDINHKKPMLYNKTICQYTLSGRQEIYQKLHLIESVIKTLNMLANLIIPQRSIEYMDNLVPLYAAQSGKCAVTGRIIGIDELHCHHIIPTIKGGTDNYDNLVIVCDEVHRLIHATASDSINILIDIIKPTKRQLKKINSFRSKAGYFELVYD